jgi:hypothetical protein
MEHKDSKLEFWGVSIISMKFLIDRVPVPVPVPEGTALKGTKVIFFT